MYYMKFEDETIANLILSLKQLKGVGNKTVLRLLLTKKKELEFTTDYTYDFLNDLGIKDISKGLEQTLISWSDIQKKSSEILELCYDSEISVLHPYMSDYPSRLLVNKNFPPILFCKGNILLLNAKKIVAIIGTRNPTKYGLRMGLRLSELLSEEGYVITSGLAIGSDTIAHQGALNKTSKTIAVLATPIDAPVYPKKNIDLAKEIISKNGVLISEYPPGTPLNGRELVSNLIARDEWQSGLSDGVIAIETSVRGGTNHAIKHAIKTNTPIGIFDYSSRLKEEFFTEYAYSGNVKYIQEKKASPIFLPESIEKFKIAMAEYNSSLNFIYMPYKLSKTKEKKDISEQTKLF